jgi:hypothetical protein
MAGPSSAMLPFSVVPELHQTNINFTKLSSSLQGNSYIINDMISKYLKL